MIDLMTTESAWKWLAAFVAAPVRWSFFPLFPWLAYPLLGVAAFHAHEKSSLSRRASLSTLAIGVPVLLLTSQYALSISHDLPAYYHHGLLFFLWNCLFLASWYALARLTTVKQPVVSWVAWFGQNVTACYIVQWLLIGNLATALYKTQSLLACALWFVGLVVATRWLASFKLPS
jgi:uncharacterized membrane protein